MPKEICRVGTFRKSYTVKNIHILRHPKFLRILGYETEGGNRECMHRLNAAVVLPVDWEQRLVYLIEQPRTNVALVRDPAVVRSLDIALKYGTALGSIIVSADLVHMLEAPAGIIEPEETPIETAVRELKEEVGFIVNASDLSFVSEHFTSVGGSTDRHFCYIASVTSSTPHVQPLGDGNERIATHAYTFKEAWALLRNDQIHCVSLAVLLREMFLRLYWQTLED